jgi:hypothetical protein
MPKLIELNPPSRAGIGEEALLYFIDELNGIRARSGNRFRLRPMRKDNGVLGMEDHYAVPRPLRPDTPSKRYAE